MRLSAGVLALLLAIAAPVCASQTTSTSSGHAYPARPVRLVITYPPGGTTDFVGRPVAQKFSEGTQFQSIRGDTVQTVVSTVKSWSC